MKSKAFIITVAAVTIYHAILLSASAAPPLPGEYTEPITGARPIEDAQTFWNQVVNFQGDAVLERVYARTDPDGNFTGEFVLTYRENGEIKRALVQIFWRDSSGYISGLGPNGNEPGEYLVKTTRTSSDFPDGTGSVIYVGQSTPDLPLPLLSFLSTGIASGLAVFRCRRLVN